MSAVYADAVVQRQILTPDRRLRVFVSSTLRELARERAAAQEAIASLRLAPVLFEQGARPHAPRDLYAAYVEQCDVFVGVYWQSYGWVAAGAEISGLEDELELVLGSGKPMLLYVKEPAPDREEALSALIRRIEQQASSAYRTFTSAEELRTLVTDDVALLLTERFHATAEVRDERLGLPARTTSFVGRVREVEELERLVQRSEVRLVTLTGPGGIGKTRLAVETARRLSAHFPDGVAYAALDGISDPELAPEAIADALGSPPLGPDPESGLVRHVRGLRLLLVLDNFEHLLEAAPLVTRLLEASEGLEVLATSREPLRLQGEHEYAVPPLADAVQLFRERVTAVRPDVVWDAQNAHAADEICRRVDGLPLAVELVAAGARTFTPSVLIEHLGSSLDAPSSGRRDAPARQRTIRATIDWSYGLLDDPERDLFERLGAFAGSFTIEAAGSVAGGSGSAVLSTLAALVDKSLLAHAAAESETRFRMLRVVTEYAAERLGERPDADDVRTLQAGYYEELGRAAYSGLRGRSQRGWKEVLDLEGENVHRAVQHLARTGRSDRAADLLWSVWVYWMTGSSYLEGRKVVGELLAAPLELTDSAHARLRAVDGVFAALLGDLATAQSELAEALEWLETHSDEEALAVALVGLGVATAPFDGDRARALFVRSARLFAGVGDHWAEAMTLGALGWLDAGRGAFAEEERFVRAYAVAGRLEDDLVTAHTATNLAELHIALGRQDEARAVLDVALAAIEAVRLYDGLSYGLEAAAGLALGGGRSEDAARLLGAADGIREEGGVPIWGPRLQRFEAYLDSVRAPLGDEIFGSAWEQGRVLGFDAALELARQTLSEQDAAKRP